MARDEKQINEESKKAKEDSDELFRVVEQNSVNKQMFDVVDKYVRDAEKLLEVLKVDRKNLSDSIEIGNSYGSYLVIMGLPDTIDNYSPNIRELMYPSMRFAASFGINS